MRPMTFAPALGWIAGGAIAALMLAFAVAVVVVHVRRRRSSDETLTACIRRVIMFLLAAVMMLTPSIVTTTTVRPFWVKLDWLGPTHMPNTSRMHTVEISTSSFLIFSSFSPTTA